MDSQYIQQYKWADSNPEIMAYYEKCQAEIADQEDQSFHTNNPYPANNLLNMSSDNSLIQQFSHDDIDMEDLDIENVTPSISLTTGDGDCSNNTDPKKEEGVKTILTDIYRTENMLLNRDSPTSSVIDSNTCFSPSTVNNENVTPCEVVLAVVGNRPQQNWEIVECIDDSGKACSYAINRDTDAAHEGDNVQQEATQLVLGDLFFHLIPYTSDVRGQSHVENSSDSTSVQQEENVFYAEMIEIDDTVGKQPMQESNNNSTGHCIEDGTDQLHYQIQITPPVKNELPSSDERLCHSNDQNSEIFYSNPKIPSPTIATVSERSPSCQSESSQSLAPTPQQIESVPPELVPIEMTSCEASMNDQSEPELSPSEAPPLVEKPTCLLYLKSEDGNSKSFPEIETTSSASPPDLSSPIHSDDQPPCLDFTLVEDSSQPVPDMKKGYATATVNQIGPYCIAAGLTIAHLESNGIPNGARKLPPALLKNGLVAELHDYLRTSKSFSAPRLAMIRALNFFDIEPLNVNSKPFVDKFQCRLLEPMLAKRNELMKCSRIRRSPRIKGKPSTRDPLSVFDDKVFVIPSEIVISNKRSPVSKTPPTRKPTLNQQLQELKNSFEKYRWVQYKHNQAFLRKLSQLHRTNALMQFKLNKLSRLLIRRRTRSSKSNNLMQAGTV